MSQTLGEKVAFFAIFSTTTKLLVRFDAKNMIQDSFPLQKGIQ